MKTLRPDYEMSNPYYTTQTKGLNEKMGRIGSEVSKVLTLNGSDTDALVMEGNVLIIKGEMPNIPAFAHPYMNGEYMVIDARAFTNKEGQIKNLAEFQLLKRRAQVDFAWATDSHEFGSQAEFVTDVFASWFANGITRRMNMSAVENQQLRILAAIYYLRQLHRSYDMMPNEVSLTLLKVLPRILRVPAPMVDDLMTAIGEEEVAELYCYCGKESRPASEYLEMLCALFNRLTDNTYRLSPSVIVSCLSRGAFIAVNDAEMTAMSIEYPPMMFVMIWYALQKGIHGKTSIGLTVGSVHTRHNEDKFNTFMTSIFSGSAED